MKTKTLATTLLCLTSLLTFLTPLSASAQIRIMPLGDSITEGLSSVSYRKFLIPMLDAAGCAHTMVGSKTATYLNATTFSSPHEGYSGHGIEYFLNLIDNNPGIDAMMAAQNPDVVLIHLGSNDMNRSESIPGTITELDTLVTRIWNGNPNAEVYVANVIPWYGNSSNPNIGTAINNLGTQISNWVATENDSRLHLVDVRSGYAPNMMIGDGIHPNGFGNVHIAEAFMDAIDQTNGCPDVIPPLTVIGSPGTAGESLPQTHTYRGAAFDAGGSGFNRVRIAIEDNNNTGPSNQWWNFGTGQFGSYDETVASLINVTNSVLNWQITVSLPPGGNYTFYALAVDNAGNQDYYNIGVWPENRVFTVAGDTQSPTATIAAPTLGATTNTFSGTAADTGGSNLKDVLISIYNKDLPPPAWYNFSNGTFAGAVGNGGVPANLAGNSWNISVGSLPPGNYALYALARDNAGNNSSYEIRNFTVFANDTQSPTANIAAPSFGTSNTVFSGTAADAGGSGFKDVLISIYNRDLPPPAWYNFSNGTFAGAVGNGGVPANLVNTTATGTNWNISVSNLPPGNYALYALARDNAGNNSPYKIRNFTVVANDTQSPTASIAAPSFGTTNTVFSGTAADAGGSGFKDVLISIYNRDLPPPAWYNFASGTFAGAVGNGGVPANLVNTTATSTNWNISVGNLPPGNYALYALARDNATNTSSYEIRDFTVN